MNRLSIAFAAVFAALLVLAALLIPATAPTAYAQNPTRVMPTLTLTPTPEPAIEATPNPTQEAAAALFDWQHEVISRYPEGVEYVVRARSKAGEITGAQVLTWFGEDGASFREPMTWDEERSAFVFYDRFFRPPWVKLQYRFRLIDEAGNSLVTEDMETEYEDPTREWLRLEDENVIVIMFGARESLAEDLFASASSAIETLEDAFGYSLDYKPYVVVMPDAESFQEWQEYPEPQLAGRTDWTSGYTIQTLQWGEGDLVHTTVPHELAHIFQGFIFEDDYVTWFIEGNATYFEPVKQYDYEGRVRDWVNWERFPTLQLDINTQDDGPDGIGRWTYDVGYTFIKYWIDTYGMESHRLFWQAQVEMDTREALEYATGRTFEELENEWRAYLGVPGPVPTLVPTPTLAFDPYNLPTPTFQAPGG